MLFYLHLFVEETESLAVWPLSHSRLRLTESLAITRPCISVAQTAGGDSVGLEVLGSVGPSQEDEAFRIRDTKLVIFYTQGMGAVAFTVFSFIFAYLGIMTQRSVWMLRHCYYKIFMVTGPF